MKRHGWSGTAAAVAAAMVWASLPAAPARAESGADVGVAAEVWMPGAGDYDLYEAGYGAEVTFRRWCNLPFGYEVSAGFGTWEAGDGNRVGSGLADFDGDAQVLPFGARSGGAQPGGATLCEVVHAVDRVAVAA